MPRSSSSAAVRIHEPLALEDHPIHAVRSPFDPVEAEFFRRGDAGIVEPPVFLPTISFALPLAGVGFLAALTLLALS